MLVASLLGLPSGAIYSVCQCCSVFNYNKLLISGNFFLPSSGSWWPLFVLVFVSLYQTHILLLLAARERLNCSLSVLLALTELAFSLKTSGKCV